MVINCYNDKQITERELEMFSSNREQELREKFLRNKFIVEMINHPYDSRFINEIKIKEQHIKEYILWLNKNINNLFYLTYNINLNEHHTVGNFYIDIIMNFQFESKNDLDEFKKFVMMIKLIKD